MINLIVLCWQKGWLVIILLMDDSAANEIIMGVLQVPYHFFILIFFSNDM